MVPAANRGHSNTPMSAHGIFRPPTPVNEPINTYAPGTPERDALQARLREMQNERITIPMVIGGKDVHADETFEAVMRTSHLGALVFAIGVLATLAFSRPAAAGTDFVAGAVEDDLRASTLVDAETRMELMTENLIC